MKKGEKERERERQRENKCGLLVLIARRIEKSYMVSVEAHKKCSRRTLSYKCFLHAKERCIIRCISMSL